MTVGDRIRARREELGMSQKELADKIGEKNQNLSKYENNVITNIPIQKLELIAKVLGVSPTSLMGWENQKSERELLVEQMDDLDVEFIRLALHLSDPEKRMLIAQMKAIIQMRE